MRKILMVGAAMCAFASAVQAGPIEFDPDYMKCMARASDLHIDPQASMIICHDPEERQKLSGQEAQAQALRDERMKNVPLDSPYDRCAFIARSYGYPAQYLGQLCGVP